MLDGMPLVLGIIGLASTVGAGWLGWTLIQTHTMSACDRRDRPDAAEDPTEVDDFDELPTPPPQYAKSRHIPLHH